MVISLKLNNKETVFDTDPTKSLLTILRQEHLFKVKCGCEEGYCGNCMVLRDGKPVPSCIIPIGMIRGSQVITLEYFKVNNPIYNDIMTGFKKVGINLCGYCDAGKIFTAYSILRLPKRPDVPYIFSAIRKLDCCCTDKDTLVNGILYGIATKHAREGKAENGK